MSASLVGSEMCIRDSGCTVSTSGWRAESALGAPVRGGSSFGSEAPKAGCLLYTSDAADDM
eukprot:2520643-Alexandrium_andersonii.AAC.1